MQLIGLLAAHWQARPHGVWPVQLVTAVSPLLAVQSLPYTLPALMQRQEWLPAVEPVTRRFIRLVSASEGTRQEGIQERHQGIGQLVNQRGGLSPRANSHVTCDIPCIAAACLVAMREHLADDAWQHMPQVLTCIRQRSGQ